MRGLHHLAGTQGDRFHAAQAGPQPRGFPGASAALRRCSQAAGKGNRDPRAGQPLAVPDRAHPGAGSGAGCMGGDSGVSRFCDCQPGRRAAVPAFDDLAGHLRNHPCRLGQQFEVRPAGSDALGGADGGLRDRHGIRAGGRSDGVRQPQLRRNRRPPVRGPGPLVHLASGAVVSGVFHFGRGRDQSRPV